MLLITSLISCGSPDEGPGPRHVPTHPEPTTSPTEETPPTEPPQVEPTYVVLDPIDRLVRASMELRAVRPSVEELDQVIADPAKVDELIGGFVDDPRFAGRVGALFAEIYWTRHEHDWVTTDYFLAEYSVEELARSVGEEPMMFLTYLTQHKLPITELVEGDWTMANAVLADMWPVDYPEGATGWEKVHYTDGRPAAGLLVSNGMWWKFGSMEQNLNRKRANQLSRVFLCHDYLDMQIQFDDSPIDAEEAMTDAVREDPNCTVCHESLDPLASHMFGFFYFSARKLDPIDIVTYHPERERVWAEYGMPPPAFMGKPTSGLAELGHRIAQEERFRSCFVEQSWELLMRRPAEPAEELILDRVRQDFEADGLTVHSLWRDLALSDAFSDGGADHGRRVADPHLLSDMVFDLTGYRMAVDDWDLLRGSLTGYSALAGGAYGFYRFDPIPEPGATFVLVNKRLAEAAATWVVDDDFDGVGTRRLLTLVDADTNLLRDRALIATQLVELHKRILGEVLSPDDPTIDADLALMERAATVAGSSRDAWIAIVSLLLRDPRFVIY